MNKAGYTIAELAVSIAIVGLIAAGAAATIGQVLRTSRQNADWSAATRAAQAVGYWVSQDALMAGVVTPGDDAGTPDREVMTMRWQDEETGNVHVARYVVSPPEGPVFQVERNVVTTDLNGVQLASTSTFIAGGITLAQMASEGTGRWLLSVAAQSGTRTASREYLALQRASSQ